MTFPYHRRKRRWWSRAVEGERDKVSVPIPITEESAAPRMTKDEAYRKAIQELVAANTEYQSQVTKTMADLFAALDALTESHDSAASEIAGGKAVFTVAEAAAYLRVSKGTVYELLRTRQLDSIQIGRRKIIPGRALQKLFG